MAKQKSKSLLRQVYNQITGADRKVTDVGHLRKMDEVQRKHGPYKQMMKRTHAKAQKEFYDDLDKEGKIFGEYSTKYRKAEREGYLKRVKERGLTKEPSWHNVAVKLQEQIREGEGEKKVKKKFFAGKEARRKARFKKRDEAMAERSRLSDRYKK